MKLPSVGKSKSNLDLGITNLLKNEHSEAGQNETQSEVNNVSDFDRFEDLAKRKEWEKLGSLAHQLAEKDSDSNPMALLWSAKSELALGRVSPLLIVSLIERASTVVIQNGHSLPNWERLKQLTEEVLLESCKQLKAVKETDLALTFAHRAFLLNSKHSKFLLEFIESELARETDNEQITFLQGLKAQVTGNKTDSQTNYMEKSNQVKFATWKVILALILLVLLFLSLYSLSKVEKLSVAKLQLESVQPLPEMILPSLNTREGSTLDAVYYQIEELKNNSNDSTTNIKVEQNKTGATVASEPKTSESVVLPQKLAVSKIEIDTNKPQEPSEVYNIVHSNVSENSQGTVEPQSISVKSKIELEKGSDTVEAKEFVVFQEPKSFRIIAITKVMSKASYFALPVAELLPGDKVMVDGTVGKWLKLRSKHGSVGFILSQNARAE